MNSTASRKVANPPSKPLLLFDGDCHFCRGWVERWRERTGDRVEYASSQEAGARFPEISAEEFGQAVQFVEPDGRVFSGAAAVFHSLGYARGGGALRWSYRHLPGFAAVSESGYAIIARNRILASRGTRLLWGRDVRRPTYFATRDFFLRALGLVFLIAFLSLWVQVDGLIGQGGILPAGDYLGAAQVQVGARAWYLLPTLFWFGSSNAALHLVCGLGVVFSLLLIAGLLPAFCLFALVACYLSLTVVAQSFLSFQWDILLLETGFLALFFAPWSWRLGRGHRAVAGSSRVGLFLLKLLLFKLMFMSGVVKLTSGDSAWWDLTALTFHYETQPLPTVLGWWAHQAPLWLQRLSTAFALVVELVAPFLIWSPRRLRVLAFWLLLNLQLLILLTGNYAFFNLLTIVLCLLLIDDALWPRWWRGRAGAAPLGMTSRSPALVARQAAAIVATILLLPLNGWLIVSALWPQARPPRLLGAGLEFLQPFRIVSGYGLFRVMTKERPEIIIEGSRDGIDWLPYEFRWKPGPLDRPPPWVAPHQPRLDWQMWFAALGSPRQNYWFVQLITRLFENSPDVVVLLQTNPFPEAPPRYLRARLYEYHFTTVAERGATGAWWKAEERGEYLPPVSLR